MAIELIINGVAVQLDAPLSVAAWLAQQGLTGKRVAVEKNGEIVPKSLHAQTLLEQDDRIEIVVAVGGG
jgi:sulfur carrier protein